VSFVCRCVVEEIISTEKTYVDELCSIVEVCTYGNGGISNVHGDPRKQSYFDYFKPFVMETKT